jgi:hypothetical protein
MNDRSLDAETAERMLRGQPAGSPELAALLAAASAGFTDADPRREEAAVAAFRTGSRVRRPSATRRLPALLSLRAVLIGLVVVLTGGVAVAATTQHLPGPLGHRHPGVHTRTPATSRTFATPAPHRAASSRPAPDRNGSQTPQQKPKKPHKKAKKAKKPKKNKGGAVTGTLPGAGVPRKKPPKPAAPHG